MNLQEPGQLPLPRTGRILPSLLVDPVQARISELLVKHYEELQALRAKLPVIRPSDQPILIHREPEGKSLYAWVKPRTRVKKLGGRYPRWSEL